jgi:hypothetical protein
MNRSTFFSIHALISGLFGVAFTLAPATVLSFYGTIADSSGVIMGRFFGTALLTYAVILWLARDADDSKALHAIQLGFFITLTIGAFTALYLQLTEPINALGWTSVLIYAVTAVGHGYYYSKRSTS